MVRAPALPDSTLTELRGGDEVRRDGCTITALEVRHRGPALGYAIVEDERPGRLDAELAQQLGVGFGPDFGRLQRGEVVGDVRPEQVMGPARPGRKVVLSGDTAPCDIVRLAAHEADLLVHEATFLDEEAERARRPGTRPRARPPRSRRTHRSGCSPSRTCRRATPGSRSATRPARCSSAPSLPRDFDTIEVPFAEKGEPELHRWDPERAGSAPPA